MKQLILFVIMVFSLALSSCQNEQLEYPEDDMVNIDVLAGKNNFDTDISGVSCINGALHFENAETVFDVVKKLSSMPNEVFTEWEKKCNFKSLKTTINEAYQDMENSSGFYIYNSKYSKYLYLDEDSCMTAYVNAEMYQLICNADGEFYVQNIKHRVERNMIIMTDMENGKEEVVSCTNGDGLSRGAGAGYTVAKKIYNEGKESVIAYIGTYIFSVKDETNKETYQMMLEYRSKARARYLGGWHETKAIHGLEGASFIAKDIAFLENGKVVRKWAKGKARSLYSATEQVNSTSVVALGDPVYERLSNDKTAIYQATLKAETNELPRFHGAAIFHGAAANTRVTPWFFSERDEVCDPRTKTGYFQAWKEAADLFDNFYLPDTPMPMAPIKPVDLSARMDAV